MFSSIKARVVGFYITVLLLILSILGVGLYLSLHKIVYDAIDAGLLSKAKALATLVNNEVDEEEFKFSDDIMWEYSSPKAMSFFQIRRSDGSSMERSTSLGDFQLPWHTGEASPAFETIFVKGAPARLVSLAIQKERENQDGKPPDQGLVIQCAENIGDRLSLLHNYKMVLGFAVMIIMFISAFGGFFIAAKALAPIKDISGAIGRISDANLSERIAVENIPEELSVLAASFNRTFDRLEKSFEQQKRFVADASHELKTPLSVILSQSEITLRRERTGAEYQEALRAILHTVRMMSDIVRKLLAVACLSTDKVELKMENLDLGKLIQESVKLLTPVASRMEIEIDTCVPEATVVRGDQEALLELLINILDNAVKYNVPKGRVAISVSSAGCWVVTVVRDSGIGIPAEDLDKVFDRFYRVDKSRSRRTGGSGLGLSIADEIVRLLGGRIEISSQAGMGTTVSVFLREAHFSEIQETKG